MYKLLYIFNCLLTDSTQSVENRSFVLGNSNSPSSRARSLQLNKQVNKLTSISDI